LSCTFIYYGHYILMRLQLINFDLFRVRFITLCSFWWVIHIIRIKRVWNPFSKTSIFDRCKIIFCFFLCTFTILTQKLFFLVFIFTICSNDKWRFYFWRLIFSIFIDQLRSLNFELLKRVTDIRSDTFIFYSTIYSIYWRCGILTSYLIIITIYIYTLWLCIYYACWISVA